MCVAKLLRANVLPYGVLFCLFVFVCAYQVRISLDTIHVERNLDFYIPFTLQTFTDRVEGTGPRPGPLEGIHSLEDARPALLSRGDQLLLVNGRPFDGMSVYLNELSKVGQGYRYPFVVTVRTGFLPSEALSPLSRIVLVEP
jgi:hypothetical protein